VRPVSTLPGVRAAWAYYRVARSLWLYRRLGYTWRPAGCRTLPYQVHRVTDEQEAMQRDHDPGVEIRGLHLRRSADMTTEDAEWRVSSFSGGDGCVDVAPQRDDDGSLQEVLLRHSKVPDSPVLRLSPEGWLKFCDWIRSEEAS